MLEGNLRKSTSRPSNVFNHRENTPRNTTTTQKAVDENLRITLDKDMIKTTSKNMT
jgi:hypothetical protein